MDKAERTRRVLDALAEAYPEAKCGLNQTEPWKLLVATRLSAQCKDARVNKTTPKLFACYPTVEALAQAQHADVYDIVACCGLGNQKAADLIRICQALVKKHKGKVPSTREELWALSGVGKKSANLILNECFNGDFVVPDTHCIRVSNRLMFTTSGSFSPISTERELMERLPKGTRRGYCHRVVALGREYCTAREKRCIGCPLKGLCPNGVLVRE